MSKTQKQAKPRRTKSTQKKSTKSQIPKPLTVSQVHAACPLSSFDFRTTKERPISHDIISQKRAVRAIEVGLGIRKPGYNIYVAGIQGTGKTSVMRTFLERWSKDSETPCDWIYVYDFNTTEAPQAISMDPGKGHLFARGMDQCIKLLRDEIPKALQSEDYENAVNAYLSQSNELQSRMFSELEKLAKTLGYSVKSTRIGIETIPFLDGRALTEKEYNKLTEEQREELEAKRSKLEPEVLDFARKVRAAELENKKYVDGLQQEIGRQVVEAILEPLNSEFGENEQVSEYIDQVEEHILENLLDFVEEEMSDEEGHPFHMPDTKDKFRKYRVNVFVDNRKTDGAPIIIESNPTYYNLFGKIEKNVENGMYLTDFSMIHAGSIHKANGGYLVLNAQDIFKTASVWDTLKRVMRNRRGYIEDMGEQYSLLPTSGLRPKPIPLDLKVILIGNDEIYHFLFQADEDFPKIFKIKADFDYRMPRNPSNIDSYVSFCATRSHLEGLLHFDRSGLAAVVEYGSRLVEDQEWLSTQFGEVKDLTIEADYLARERGAKKITRTDIEAAQEQRTSRVNLYEEHVHKMFSSKDLMVSVDGDRVGQINGLSVYDMGDYSFGRPGRITCTIAMNGHGVFNVERASKLSGNIHDKGIYILTGFLNSLFAKHRSLGFSASVCFEQSYGMVDGDSATAAELTTIISALADIPIRQNFAMTGSLNQFGDIQPVGGINEKIEGFFKVCDLIGSSDCYDVVIPIQNADNLMLSQFTREAIKAKRLRVFAVSHFWEAFELATGVDLGIRTTADEPKDGSAAHQVMVRLDAVHNKEILEKHGELTETEIAKKKRVAAKS